MSGRFRDRTRDFVLGYLEASPDIKHAYLVFTDINGRMKSSYVNTSQLEDISRNGKVVDGSSVEGLERIHESDVIEMPDLSTLVEIPGDFENHGEKYRECMTICDILKPNGKPHPRDPRNRLKEAIKKSEKMGFDRFFASPEIEFFVFEPGLEDGKPKTIDMGTYFDVTNDPYRHAINGVMVELGEMGIVMEGSQHEVAPSQHELNLKYSDALQAADNTIYAKFMLKEGIKRIKKYATFMPKPLNGVNGSGMHVHQSLSKNGENVFFDEKDKQKLSETAKFYSAGILHYVKECTAIYNNTINSYKRLRPGYEAPVYIVHGTKNRSALARIPEFKNPKAARIELRSPDLSGNIYLQLATMLVSGLNGIKNELELPPPYEKNVYENTENIDHLPSSMEEAVNLTQKGTVVREALGDSLFRKFVQNKKKEAELYRKGVTGEFHPDGERYGEVTRWELETYFPVL